MPTAIAARLLTPASSFALRAVAWGLGLFGLLRLPWIETHALLPLTRAQGHAAVMLTGAPALPIDVTLACSGADVLAMCAGVILAYPARWRRRLAGAAGSVLIILTLNVLRIGTLGRASGSPAVFETLHLYVWPAVLALAAAGYAFGWMRWSDRAPDAPAVAAADAAAGRAPARMARPTRRFLVLAAVLIAAFAAASPLYLDSAWVLAVASFIARATAATLRAAGLGALASGNLLITGRGGFAVTQECISTPLIPVYIAAVIAYAGSWRVRVPALLAVVPIFVALGIARLLVVALPAGVVASPLFFIHAFYQLLTAAVVIVAAALWHQGRDGWRRASLAVGVGAICLYLLSPLVSRLLTAGPAFADPQGALALLPSFQVALFVALWAAVVGPARWRTFAVCLVVLGLSQAALFSALQAGGAFAAVAANVPAVRAWALAVPLVMVAGMRMHDPAR